MSGEIKERALSYKLTLPKRYQKVPLLGLLRWTGSLRSGAYPQGSECLLDERGRYCCLGVLAAVEGMDISLATCGRQDSLPERVRQYEALGGSGTLPEGVEIDIIATHAGGHSCIDHTTNFLASVNDAGLTFLQIADILEAVYENAPDPEP